VAKEGVSAGDLVGFDDLPLLPWWDAGLDPQTAISPGGNGAQFAMTLRMFVQHQFEDQRIDPDTLRVN